MNVTFEGERFFEVELRFRRCTVCFNVNGMFEIYCKLKLGRLTNCTKKNDVLKMLCLLEDYRYVRM